MTLRERVIEAVKHHETDKVPHQIHLTHQAHDRLAEYWDDPKCEKRLGNHIEGAYYDGYLEETAPGSGYWRDHFGVLWNRNGADKDIGVIEGQVLPEPTLAGYKFPELDVPRLRSEYESLIKNAGDKCRMGAIGFSMYERGWTLRGMENLLMDMLAEPNFVDELLDAVCEHNLKIIDIALEYPIDFFHFGDDWGQQKGLIMGPSHWRRFIKPLVARMYQRVLDSGRFVSQHSCGDIHEILPDLIDIGLSVYQTFQPEIYDVRSAKREYGKHLTFWGGISTQRVLPYATPDEVKQVAQEMMKIMSVSGGYIAAPTHDIPADVPAENIVALIEAFNEQS